MGRRVRIKYEEEDMKLDINSMFDVVNTLQKLIKKYNITLEYLLDKINIEGLTVEEVWKLVITCHKCINEDLVAVSIMGKNRYSLKDEKNKPVAAGVNYYDCKELVETRTSLKIDDIIREGDGYIIKCGNKKYTMEKM